MKICFICSNLWPHTLGGAERRYYEFARELMARGHDVVYITYDWGPSEVPTIPLGPPPKLYNGEGHRRLLPALTFGIKAAKAAGKANCDVIDATVPYTEIPHLPPRRTILTIHEIWGPMWREYYGPLAGALVARAEKWILKKPAAVVVPTEVVARKARGVRPDVEVVPFGIRPEDYLPYRTPEKIYDAAAVGRMVPYKGWDTLTQILKKVEKPLRVVVIGDGPLRHEILHKLRQTHHEIHHIPHATEEEKKKLLGQARVYINTSRTEGFSITTLEAIALGAQPLIYDPDGHNAAAELVKTATYGKVARTVEEAAEALANPPRHPPPTDLAQYHIKNIIDRYEKILQSIQK